MRELVKIVTVKELLPIEGADRIVLATMEDNIWKCIVSKDEFKPGDLGVFFEVDSVLPETDDRFAFMLSRKMRVKTMRMKGVLSQGLLMPLSKFPEIQVYLDAGKTLVESSPDKDDLAVLLKVIKYEPREDHSTGPGFANKTKRESTFPKFIPKTDQERIQNVPNMIFDLLKEDNVFYASEKLDGTSCTVYKYQGKLGVCSRNFELEDKEDCNYWATIRKQKLDEVLSRFDNIALQGEIIGPRIQGNKYKLEEPRFYLFDIFDIQTQKYYTPDQFDEFIKYVYDVYMIAISHAPFRWMFNQLALDTLGITNAQELLDYCSNRVCNISLVNTEVIAEGLVVRTYDKVNYQSKKLSFFDEVAHCKIINNNFLIKYGE